MSRQSTQELSRVASRQVDRIADAAGNALDRVKHLGERGSDIARATGAMAMDKARLAADHTADRIRRDPLKSVLIAVAAGAAVAVIASHMAHRRQNHGGDRGR